MLRTGEHGPMLSERHDGRASCAPQTISDCRREPSAHAAPCRLANLRAALAENLHAFDCPPAQPLGSGHVPERATGGAASRRLAGHHPPLDGDRLPAVHAHRRRSPAHRRARHRRPRQGHRRQQPPRRPARPRARGRRAHQHVDRAGREARPHRAAARDRHAHDQPARLPLLRHLRVRPRGTTRCARWPSTTTPAGACRTRARTACATSRSRAACSTSRSPPWSTSTTRTPTRPRSPSCAGRATAACSWCRSSCRDAASGLLEVVDQKRSRAVLAPGAAPRRGDRRPGGGGHPERQAVRRAAAQRRGRRPPARGAGAASPRTSRASARASAAATCSATVADAVCEALGAISCVASMGGESAGAFGAGRVAAPSGDGAERGANASLVVARDPSGRTDLTLAVTLPHAPGEGQVELLDFVAAVAAVVAAALSVARSPPRRRPPASRAARNRHVSSCASDVEITPFCWYFLPRTLLGELRRRRAREVRTVDAPRGRRYGLRMYLSVQLAARRLGVSPHTIRRWTASGFLPCTRTAGGHRRIKQEDIDELAHLIGGRNHLAARLARERELETLVATAIAVSSQLDAAGAAARDRQADDHAARRPPLRHLRLRPHHAHGLGARRVRRPWATAGRTP